MQESEVRIGAYLLEIITTGMYTNPLDTVREYIQNSTDSLLEAVREGKVDRDKARIRVAFDPRSRNLSVRDEGMGIPADEVSARLVSVGISNKKIGVDAGFRGIGRLAGTAFCRKLMYETSAIGEDIISRVEFDCEGMRQAVARRDASQAELASVIASNTMVFQDSTSLRNEHYCTVQMVDIGDDHGVFLDRKALTDYLREVAPVAFDQQWFCYAPRIVEWTCEQGIDLPEVTLVLEETGGNSVQIFKPYSTLETSRSMRDGNHEMHITGVEFLQDSGPQPRYWGWIGKSKLEGQIGNNLTRGLRFRMHNISIGEEAVSNRFFRECNVASRFNGYFVGEIHIIDDRVLPNARRDWFENNPTWQAISNDLGRQVKQLEKRVRVVSTERNSKPAKAAARAARLITKYKDTSQESSSAPPHVITHAEARQAMEDIGDSIRGIDDSRPVPGKSYAGYSPDQLREQLEYLRSQIGSQTNGTVALASWLDKKQRKVITTLLDTLHSRLDAEPYRIAKETVLELYGPNARKNQ